jgi:glycosyltransferase involved in cell wall biosynthesis
MGALLSAALIVKNEEKFLGDCLASLRGLADEVVVVDTGSTDRTQEIARSGGARVYDFPWNGDFAAARNRALDLSTGEWILYIDADERVRPDATLDLRAELSDPLLAGCRVLLHPLKRHTPFGPCGCGGMIHPSASLVSSTKALGRRCTSIALSQAGGSDSAE